MKKKLATKNVTQEKSEIKCFVSNCTNKKLATDNGNRNGLQFFQVPDGIEGLFWEKAVKIRQRRYGKMIDLLSSTEHTLGLDVVNKTTLANHEYCCEVHFDIYADIEGIINENGFFDYKVKPGVVPQIKPRQTKRLCDYYNVQSNSKDDCEMNSDIIKEEESMTDGEVTHSNNVEEYSREIGAAKNGYISLVDISTLTNGSSSTLTNGKPDTPQPDINYDPILPMLPLTTAMMKRKSPYYMGLQQNHFVQLLELAHQNKISDVKVMITLRKIRLNEEFEALGDLFDLDKATTERYFKESSDQVVRLVDILYTPDDNSYTSKAVKFEESTNTTTAYEQHSTLSQGKNDNEVTQMDKHEDDDDDTPSECESESSSLYEPSEPDSDIVTDDLLSSSDESVCGEKTKQCSLCNQWFTKLGIAQHFNATHSLPLDLNKTTCGLCLQKFDTNVLLLNHQGEVHGGNAFGCDLCSKQCRKKRQIITHMLTKHAKVQTFLCEICGEGFPHQGDLTLHFKRKHWKIRSYGCHLCDWKYATSIGLKDHIRSTHTDERPFKCTFEGCTKTFSRQNVLRNHSRVHATDRFECDVCSKHFSFKANLTTHKRNIHGMMI